MYLYAVPEIHVRDMKVIADFDYENERGILTTELDIVGESDYSVKLTLTDKNGNKVYESDTANVTASIPDVMPWSAEVPNLYTLTAEIIADGEIVETAETKVGFRTFELKNNLMCLNGKRIIFKGINRHEWNANGGRVVTEEDMLWDIRFMKQNNINAVRTCHYPNNSLWYHLCDEYGIYLIDETNLETHGTWQKMGACEPSINVPASLPEWKEACLDRAKSMYERDKGHEISFAQEIVETPVIKSEITAAKAEIVYGDFSVGVHGENFSMLFDKREGGISSLIYNGTEYITRAPKISFWRAMTDNDAGAGYPFEMAQWQIAGKYAKQIGFDTEEHADRLDVTYTFVAPTVPAFEYMATYSAYFDGRLGVKADYPGVKGMADMPVFAMDFKMKKQYNAFTFYGMGPDENYIDRNNGARLGVYTSNAQDNFTKYLNPQECGNRTGVRYVNVYEENGTGLAFTSTETPFEMSVLPYSAYELDNALHREELPEPSYTWVRIAAKQMGVGGDDSWGAPVHQEFKIESENPMTLQFVICSL